MPHKVLISLRERRQQDQGPLDRCRLACGCGCVGVQEEHIPVCHVRLGYDGGGIHSSCSTVGDGQRCGVQLGQSPDRTGCQHHTGRLLYIGLGMIHGKMAFVSPPPPPPPQPGVPGCHCCSTVVMEQTRSQPDPPPSPPRSAPLSLVHSPPPLPAHHLSGPCLVGAASHQAGCGAGGWGHYSAPVWSHEQWEE